MYNKILMVIILLMSITSNAQKINADDLLTLIRREGDAFHVFEKKFHYLNMGKSISDDLKNINLFNDSKSAYYNIDLKEELLKLLTDTIGYINFYIEENISNLKMNKDLTQKNVITWTQSHYPNLLDSVINSDIWLKKFQDSLIKYESQYYIKNYNNMELSYQTIEILSKIKYPEAYQYFYNRWQDDNKNIDSKWFDVMLNFQDPEVEDLYFQYIDKCIIEHNDLKIRQIINFSNTFLDSFHIKVFLYLLEKDIFILDEFGNSKPLQYFLFYPLSQAYTWVLYENKDLRLILDSINDTYITEGTNTNLYKKYITEIKNFYQTIYSDFSNNELYWKQNMPYYKKEDD